jgi:hypothetical protein
MPKFNYKIGFLQCTFNKEMKQLVLLLQKIWNLGCFNFNKMNKPFIVPKKAL